MRSALSNWIKSLAIVAGGIVGASSVQAGLTSIGARPSFEVGQESIFEHQYGGDWHKVGDDFYNGTMSAKRMDDWLSNPGVLSIGKGACGYSDDERWSGGKFTMTAVAKWSGNAQKLNLIDSSGHVHDLLDVKGYGFDIDPASATIDMHNQQFKFQRTGDSGTQSSVDAENADLRDHLITYVIEGLPGQTMPVWMMFWEDMNRFSNTPLKRTWADYNDLAVEIRSAPHAVPLPPAGWAGLFTLAGCAAVRGRRLLSQAPTA
jgi:hypothetical protein